MPSVVELSDGRVVEFPDGTAPEVMTAALRRDFPKQFPDTAPTTPPYIANAYGLAQMRTGMVNPSSDRNQGEAYSPSEQAAMREGVGVNLVKNTLGLPFEVAAAGGKAAFAAGADLVANTENYNREQELKQAEAAGTGDVRPKLPTGNLAALLKPGPLPAEQVINEGAADAPKLAVVANIAKELPGLAAMSGVGIGGRLISGGFAADMLWNAKPTLDEYRAEMAKPESERDAGKVAALRASLITTGIFAPLAAGHALRGEATPATRVAAMIGKGKLPAGEINFPIPEPIETLDAQVAATLKPDSPKAVTLVTPGAEMPKHEGLVRIETAQGWALVNTDKVEPALAKSELDAGRGGILLGMSTERKPEIGGQGAGVSPEPVAVLQTKNADGTVVQDEVVTPATAPSAIEAGKSVAPGGTQEVKPAEQVIAERQGSGFVPPQMPERFDTLASVMDYRSRYKAAEISFYKSLGLTDAEAAKFFRAGDARSQLDVSAIEDRMTPENRERLEKFSTGEGATMYQWDRQYDPGELAHETSKHELARHVVQNVLRGELPQTFGDRTAHAALALRKLQELGGTWKDVAKELDSYTTRNSSSQGDKTEYFASAGNKLRTFAAQQGIDLPLEEVKPAEQVIDERTATSMVEFLKKQREHFASQRGAKPENEVLRHIDDQIAKLEGRDAPSRMEYPQWDVQAGGWWFTVPGGGRRLTTQKALVDDIKLRVDRDRAAAGLPLIKEATWGATNLPLGISAHQLEQMRGLSSNDQIKDFGVSVAQLIERATGKDFAAKEAAKAAPKLPPRERLQLERQLKESRKRLDELTQKGDAAISPNDPMRKLSDDPVGKSRELVENQIADMARRLGKAATPAAAVAKVEAHVEDVASGAKPIPAEVAPRHPLASEGEKLLNRRRTAAATERAGAAKEIKSELVQRLEKALAEAPEKKAGGQDKQPKITIDIPGDGTFTIWNDKATIGEMLKRAQSLDTRAAIPVAKLPVSRGRDSVVATEKDAERIYGGSRAAIPKLRAQADNMDLEMSDELRANLRAAADEMESNLPENRAKAVIGIATEELQSLRAEEQKLNTEIDGLTAELKGIESEIGQRQGAGKGVRTLAVKRDKLQQKLGTLGRDFVKLRKTRIPTEERRLAEAEAALQKLGSQPGSVPNKGRVAASGTSSPRTPAPARSIAAVPTANLPPPQMGPVRQWFANQGTSLRSVFAAGSLPGAGDVANVLRHYLGERALNLDRAEAAMHAMRNEFDRTPVPGNWQFDPNEPLPHNFAVIDAFERNRAALPSRYQQLASFFDQAFAERIAVIQRFAPDALQKLITNYFPHVWADPVRAQDVMAQMSNRLFAGRKEFMKARTLPLFAEGLARGLKPISDNPVDLLLAKMHSMDKFIMALKAQAEFKETGALKFKYALEPMPDGWVHFDDPAFVVHAPPLVTLKEAFDAQLRTRTLELLQKLGVPNSRLASLGGKRWGLAYESPEQIKTRFGGPMSVYWHELGHILDFRYDLQNDFLKQGKVFDDQLRALADARAGGKPVTPHFHKYLRKGEEKMAVMLEAYTHAPDLFRSLAPDVWQKFDQFITAHPELHEIRQLKPGLELGTADIEKKLPGVLKLGDWIMPAGPAQVIKNYLSPGLGQFAAYRSLRTASNVLNGAQLGLSGFHLGFTSLDSATSALALGIKQVVEGRALEGLKTLAEVPVSPVSNLVTGARLRAEALRPGTHPEFAPLVEALQRAGGRVGNDRMWQTEFTRRMIRAWHEGGLQWATLPIRAPLAAWEQAMRPILEYVVPRQKLGVFARMASDELAKLGPNADVHAQRAALGKVWDSVDNRMGQVVYDNLFYNRAVKDVALMTFRAYGWQLGKYREGVGAVVDTGKAVVNVARGQRPELSHRMAYAMALPLMVGTIGGMINYLMTGQAPQQARDYFQPRTGETDNNENAVRLNLPSYVKDVVAYSRHPVESVGHSLNPLWSGMVDLLQNKDFYNVQIRNPEDPLWQQGGDVAKFAAKQFVPFSVSGAQKLREEDAPAWKSVAPFFGVTPVPQRQTMTPAQELAAEITSAAMPSAPRTQAQGDKGQMIAGIVKDLKKGNRPEAVGALAGGLQAQTLNAASVTRIIEKSLITPLEFQVQHMDALAAMRVWRLANEPERAKLRFTVLTKVANSKTLTREQIQKLAAEMGFETK